MRAKTFLALRVKYKLPRSARPSLPIYGQLGSQFLESGETQNPWRGRHFERYREWVLKTPISAKTVEIRVTGNASDFEKIAYNAS